MFSKNSTIGVIGSGAMGSGITQVAAMAGHKVILSDASPEALKKAGSGITSLLQKLVEKQKITPETMNGALSRITYSSDPDDFASCELVIEAIVENLEVKKGVFAKLDKIVSSRCVLATNTSSLSVTSIATAIEDPSRFLGIHFFNPAPLMPLVEIIPGIATHASLAEECMKLISGWGKVPVIAKDTPGFIVNRVARPFYSEALRIADEGLADFATIDHAMRSVGGFRMGPFELMDMIGHDVNYVVTETVWRELYFDPRFKPSTTQKRLLEAGFLGRKSGRGFYNYSDGAVIPKPSEDNALLQMIFLRVLCMLVNEAADAVYLGVASEEHVELAMTKGVNYPKGLFLWGREIGFRKLADELKRLHDHYQEDRYRVSPLLRRLAGQI